MVKLLLDKKSIEKIEAPDKKGSSSKTKTTKKVITLADLPYIPKEK